MADSWVGWPAKLPYEPGSAQLIAHSPSYITPSMAIFSKKRVTLAPHGAALMWVGFDVGWLCRLSQYGLGGGRHPLSLQNFISVNNNIVRYLYVKPPYNNRKCGWFAGLLAC